MTFFCSHCGQKLEVTEPCVVSILVCPACRGTVPVPKTVARLADSPPNLSGAGVSGHQRQPVNQVIVGSVVAVLFLLAFLLFQQSSSKLLQQAKQAVFGRHLAAAMGDGSGVSPTAVGHSSGASNAAADQAEAPSGTGTNPSAQSRESAGLPGTSRGEFPLPAVTDPRTSNFMAPPVSLPESASATNIIPRPNQPGDPDRAFLSSDFHKRLEQAGAKSGDVQISLLWNNYNDLDLHCVDPRGETIFFQHRRSASGGELDVDMNAGAMRSIKPVENIYWPASGAPAGNYKVYVNHYANHGGQDPTQYTVRILVKGQAMQFYGIISSGQRMQLVHQFKLGTNP